MATEQEERTAYARVETRRYIDQSPGPLADLGAPWDQFRWTALIIFAVVVGATALVGSLIGDVIDAAIPGIVGGATLAYLWTQVKEPYLTQVEGFVLRRHVYSPVPPPLPTEGHPRLLPLRRSWARLTAPAPSWRLLSVEGTPKAALAVDNAGVLTRPDGGLIACWRVEPFNAAGRSDAELARILDLFAEIPTLLTPGQRVQIVVDSLSVRAEEEIARLDSRQAAQAGDAVTGEYVPLRQTWLERRYAGNQVADRRMYLVVEDARPAAMAVATARVRRQTALLDEGRRAAFAHVADELRGLLSRMGLDAQALRGPEVAALVARAVAAAPRHDAEIDLLPTAGPDVPPLISVPDAPLSATPLAAPDPDGDHPAPALATQHRVAGRLHAATVGASARRLGRWLVDRARYGKAGTPAASALAPGADAGPGAGAPRPTRSAPATVSALHAAVTAVPIRERVAHLEVGGRYARTLYALAPPRRVHPLWPTALVKIPQQARLSIVIEGRSKEREVGRLERFAQRAFHLNEAREDGRGTRKVRLSAQQREHQQTLEELEDPDVGVYQVGLALTVMADSLAELRGAVGSARAAFRATRCPLGQGWADQLPLYLSTLPLGRAGAGPGHLFRATTPTVATVFPFDRESPGHTQGMPLGVTAGREQVYLDLDAPDISTQQIMLVGVPNSGKSVAMNEIALQTYLEGNGVTLMDRSGSYRALCDALGGTYLTLLDQEGTPPAINPWELFSRANRTGRVQNMLGLHDTMYGRGEAVERLSNWQYTTLAEAIDRVYSRAREPGAAPYPVESELIAELRGQLTGRLPAARTVELEDMLLGFSNYVGTGPWASLADQQTTAGLEHRFIVLDTRHCVGKNALVAYRLISALVEWRAAQRLTQRRVDGSPAIEMQGVDEGWDVIGLAGEDVDRATRTSRHLRRRYVFSTQFVSDAADDPRATALLNSVPVLLIFRTRNERAGQRAGNAWLGQTLGLTQREVDSLGGLHVSPGRYAQAFMVVRSLSTSESKRGVFNMELPPWDIELFKTQPLERDARAAAVAAHGGNVWAAIKSMVEKRAA